MQRKIYEREENQNQVPDPDFPDEDMSIDVSQKEHRLKKHETGKPYMNSSTVIRHQEPADKRLQAKEK